MSGSKPQRIVTGIAEIPPFSLNPSVISDRILDWAMHPMPSLNS